MTPQAHIGGIPVEEIAISVAPIALALWLVLVGSLREAAHQAHSPRSQTRR